MLAKSILPILVRWPPSPPYSLQPSTHIAACLSAFTAISFRIVPILAGTIIAGTRNDICHRYTFHLTKDIFLTTRKSRDSRQSVERLSLSTLSATSRNLVAQRGSRETRRKWSRRALNLVNYQRRAREILLQAPRRYESN